MLSRLGLEKPVAPAQLLTDIRLKTDKKDKTKPSEVAIKESSLFLCKTEKL